MAGTLVVDARWQMVLDVTGDDEPPFSQGALQAFRQRLIEHVDPEGRE